MSSRPYRWIAVAVLFAAGAALRAQSGWQVVPQTQPTAGNAAPQQSAPNAPVSLGGSPQQTALPATQPPASAQPDPQAWARAFAASQAQKKSAAAATTGRHGKHGKKPEPEPVVVVTPPAPVRPPTPADKPAQPAAVTFADGNLTVKADNSDLAEILRTTAQRTGMTIEGSPPSERVFGDFGPAPASVLIAKLLDGTSTNYAILTSRGGRPEKLVLSAASKTPAATAMGFGQAQPTQSNDDDDDDAPPPPQQTPRPLPFRPVPQADNENNNNQNQTTPQTTGARTPQQILQEMQQRRALQQQNGGSDPE